MITGEDYNCIHGGKWSTENLKLYLAGTRGEKPVRKLFGDISQIILHSLMAVRKVMSHNRHCFECYGYDIIVDENLKPWLIEVNSSPSLTCTTTSDHRLKSKLVDSILSVVLPPSGARAYRQPYYYFYSNTFRTDSRGWGQLKI